MQLVASVNVRVEARIAHMHFYRYSPNSELCNRNTQTQNFSVANVEYCDSGNYSCVASIDEGGPRTRTPTVEVQTKCK